MIQKQLRDLKRGALIYLNRLSGIALSARPFRLPARFDQFRDDYIAVIALDFDDAIAHGAARPTAFLKFCREPFKI
jgi:hypothetical protein